MPPSLFAGFQPIAPYERYLLYQQFSLLAQKTKGTFEPKALASAGAARLVSNIFWQKLAGTIWVKRNWADSTVISLYWSLSADWQLYFSNAYGEISGIPIVGSPRIEANLALSETKSILPVAAYWQLADAQQPFRLTLTRSALTLQVYCFYPHEFYLLALEYLTALAMRAQAILAATKVPNPHICRINLAWPR